MGGGGRRERRTGDALTVAALDGACFSFCADTVTVSGFPADILASLSSTAMSALWPQPPFLLPATTVAMDWIGRRGGGAGVEAKAEEGEAQLVLSVICCRSANGEEEKGKRRREKKMT